MAQKMFTFCLIVVCITVVTVMRIALAETLTAAIGEDILNMTFTNTLLHAAPEAGGKQLNMHLVE